MLAFKERMKSNEDEQIIESKNGYKCLLQDISESGALIKIGGKGRENIKIKLQFSIKSKLIIMVGIVRKVEYNQELNQSYLHFECTNIEQSMKNEILAFVYNMLPESEKEVLEAIKQTESDSEEILNETENSQSKNNHDENPPGEKTNDSLENQYNRMNSAENEKNEQYLIKGDANISDYDNVEFKFD